MTTIPLTKEQSAVVNDGDHEWLSNFKWSTTHNGNVLYAHRKTSRKDGNPRSVYMHRAIWERYHGPIPNGFEMDHINGNGLDNRLENLRLCTRSQNIVNQGVTRAHSSKFKGVTWCKRSGKWMAYIKHNYKFLHLGYYASEVDAAKAYNAKAKELFGEFANLNQGV